MSKKVVVLSTSLRTNSNSELLAKSFVEGAKDTGNDVEFISLKNKDIRFCIGCLACQKTGHCVIDLWLSSHTQACGMKATFHLIYT